MPAPALPLLKPYRKLNYPCTMDNYHIIIYYYQKILTVFVHMHNIYSESEIVMFI